MPPRSELPFHERGCARCEETANDLEQYRDKEIDGYAIRDVHMDLSRLSAKAMQWILPHYLRYCLTAEAIYNGMETEFLIYSLRPGLQFQKETLQQLALLTSDQIRCLIHFLQWCSNQEQWQPGYVEDIRQALNFLRTMIRPT